MTSFWSILEKAISREFKGIFNPLAPVPAVTGRDEPWPFFHVWHHHFWPKLASSIFKIDLSNDTQITVLGLMAPEICTKTVLKKLSEKLRACQSKISCHYTWPGYFMVKIARLDDAFLEVFLTANKPIRRSNTAAKRKEKGKRKGQKKNRKA